jgi:uncharacterized protein (TIGR02145 family)
MLNKLNCIARTLGALLPIFLAVPVLGQTAPDRPVDACNGASRVTYDGYTYALVGIGTQCWFIENLQSDNYRNGDPILGGLNETEWTSATVGAQTVYGEGNSAVHSGSSDESVNLRATGRLYNAFAVNDARGLCPAGYHVPSDQEWVTLEVALGMNPVRANSKALRGTDQGSRMKAAPDDSRRWDGTNSSVFTAVPGGYRCDYYGAFYNQEACGAWWTSTPSGSTAWSRFLYAGSPKVQRGDTDLHYGLSVRCLRD